VRLGRGSGGLLDEVELLEAERWLASPDATDLGYAETLPALVEASRAAQEEEAAQKRRVARFRLGALGAIVVLIIAALSIGLWSQSQLTQEKEISAQNLSKALATTEAERDRADLQAQIALSRQLAAQAFQLVPDQLDLALLLSVEANHIIETLKDRDTDSVEVRDSEIRGSLLVGLELSPHLTTYLRGHRSAVRSVAFSPDGRILASSGLDQTIILWDSATHRSLGQPLTGHTNDVNSVAFSPDGRTLASGSCAKREGTLCQQGEIRLWDIATHQALDQPLTGHTGDVNIVAFSPDGKTLASGSGDGTIILWDVAARQPLDPPLTGHKKAVMSVAFSPDGKTLASSSLDKTIILWDVTTRQPLDQPLTAQTGIAYSVAFSSDGKTLALGNSEGTVILWDIATRQPLVGQHLTGHTGEVRSVVFSPDGQTLASGSRDNTIILWDVVRRQPIGEPLIGHAADVFSVAFSPDGQTLASGGVGAEVILWNMAQNQPLGQRLIGHDDAVSSVAFSSNGEIVASGSEDKTVILWDVATRQPIGQPLTGHESAVLSVAFSPDGQSLASGTLDGTIALWDVATHQLLDPPFTGHTSGVNSIAFSSDGQVLASGSDDQTIILWDVATRQPLDPLLTGHNDRVLSVAFSPDNQMLASGSQDGAIILWDTETGQFTGSLVANYSVLSVAFSPDGSTLASLTPVGIILWDVVERELLGPPLGQLVGQMHLPRSMAFSPDGRMLASGSLYKPGNFLPTILLWDIAARQRIGQPLIGHTNSVRSLAFSPDGRTMASGSDDNTVILWDIGLESWQARACRIVGRNLTWEEWETYLPAQLYRVICPGNPLGPTEIFKQAEAYALAGEGEKASNAFAQAVKAAIETNDAALCNSICWDVSIDGFAEMVLPVCERAVELAPENGGYRDSRGLARALTGDYQGAIEDFKFYVEWGKGERSEERLRKRQEWIRQLEAGQNPFDPTTLSELRSE
jgi:WD40 repeat protein